MWSRRVLGVDVGSTSIKVAQVELAPTGRQTLRRLTLCEGPDELAGLLAFKSWWKAGDRVHLGFPSDKIVVRTVKLPFQEEAKIEQTLPFELEEEVPFSVDEIAAGHIVCQRDSEGTELLALASTREQVAGWLQRFAALGVEPAVLEPEIAALTHLIPEALQDPPRTFAVLEIGATKTNLLLQHEGQTRTVRCIRRGLGADHATLPLPEALLHEIHRTLTTLRIRGDMPWPEAIYLCGGGAAIPEVTGWLEDQWDVPVRLVSPYEAIPCAMETAPDDHPARFSTAVGLALAGARSGVCNLRTGELAYRPGLFAIRGRALAALILVLLAAAAGMADLYVHLAMKQKALAALKSESIVLFKEAFPEVTRIVDPVIQMRRLLEERKNSQLSLLGQDPRASSVEILREISLRVQSSTPLRLRELDLKGDVLSLRGEASGYQHIEGAKTRWQASPLLEEVEIKNAKKNPKTQLWEFQCVARRKFS